MTELSALNIKITGDATALTAAVNSAKGDLTGLQTAATKATNSLNTTAANASAFGRSMQGAAGHTANLTFQLQDIAMMLAAGQNPLMLAMQQGTQVSGIFMQMGASVKTIGPALKAAFAGLVSPLSLVTIGGIAAVAAFSQLAVSFLSSTEEADKLNDALEQQKESLEAVRDASERLRLERGMMSSGAQFTDEQRQIERIKELTEQRAVAQERLNNLMSIGGRAAGYAQQAEDKRAVLQSQIAEIDAELELLNLNRAKNAALEAGKAVQLEMEKILNRIANTNLSAPFINMLGPMQAAVDKARELANNLGMASGPGPAPGVPSGLGMGVNTLYGNVPAGLGGSNPMASSPRPRQAPAGMGGQEWGGIGGSGGGGGGGGGVNPLQAELEAIQEGLMTAEQLQMESFQRQQEVLQQALEQRLITQQEYQSLMEAATSQHFKTMADSSNNGATQILGALGGLFEGNKKVGAGIALINTMIGASEELKKGTFGIASAIRVIAQGMGFVRAIKGASKSGGGGTAPAASAAPAQQNVQTLNFTVQNDQFGIGANLIRQIATQLNEAQRNGSTLIRANVV